MINEKLLQNGEDRGIMRRSGKECPAYVIFLAVACTFLAGLGDWKVLNDRFGGLPKAAVLGTIICAFLNFLVAADFAKFRRAASYFPMLLIPIVLYSAVSMYIWITDLSQTGSIIRAGEKILFQTITIIYSVFMCYLLEDRAIN